MAGRPRPLLATALLAGLCSLAAAPSAHAAGRCGDHPWCDTSLSPDRRAALLLAEMTQDEKFQIMAGDDPASVFTESPATGISEGEPRVGIPTVYFVDGPAGVREGKATALPAPIGLAASFDRALARRYGAVIGNEAKNKGDDFSHAPAVNITRVPEGGRNFEYYGEDPLLAGRIGVSFTRGLQGQGVVANVKHYVANNQETNRFTTDAVVDERTLREIYLPAFEANVREGRAGSVMCAYNSVNGEDMCQHDELLDGVLKGEWGFRGLVLSDYGATFFDPRVNTTDAARGGLDLEMPQENDYSRPALTAAVGSGQISQAEIDDHVRRILRTYFAFGIFDRLAFPENGPIDRRAHALFAREASRRGATLLKNAGRQLPLDGSRLDSIAVIGDPADEYIGGGGSSEVEPFYAITPLDGLRRRASRDGIAVRYEDGRDRAAAVEAARSADVAIVVAAVPSTEFADRPCLSLECPPRYGDQDGLIRDVAAANPSTTVVLETPFAVLMPWIEQVGAVLEAWYPGMEGGNAIAEILFGDHEPGGRLPGTFPARQEDPPTANRPDRWPGIAERAHYDEGVFVGYRHYDEHAIEPLFPFGHGLTYTSFRYGGLRVERGARRSQRGSGGLWVSVRVTNTGRRRGSEVPQLYLGKPETAVPQPPRWLAGFRRVTLRPRQTKTVSFRLDERDLAYWDAGADRWAVAAGCYRAEVGRSSRDIRRSATFGRGGGFSAPARRVRLRAGRRTRVRVAVRRGGQPVPGARVTVAGAGLSRSARTDARGRAVLAVRSPRGGTARVTTTACADSLRVSAKLGPRFTG